MIEKARTVGDLLEQLALVDRDLPLVIHAEIWTEGGQLDLAVGRVRVVRVRDDAVVLST